MTNTIRPGVEMSQIGNGEVQTWVVTMSESQEVRHAERACRKLVILAYDVGARMTNYVNVVLDRLGLSLNRDKTRIVDLRQEGERLDFLGFTFRFDRNQLGRGEYLNIVPSVKSMNRVRERLRLMTRRQVQLPPEKLIQGVEPFSPWLAELVYFGYPKSPGLSRGQLVCAETVASLSADSGANGTVGNLAVCRCIMH